LDDFGAVGFDYTELFVPCTCVRMPGWPAKTAAQTLFESGQTGASPR